MQLTVKDREAINGAVTVRSRPMDVSDIPMFAVSLVVHEITGTTPQLEVQMETSDNLEDWDSVGGALSRTTAGMGLTSLQASGYPWGRYVRASIELSGSGSLAAVYSLWVNTFPSS